MEEKEWEKEAWKPKVSALFKNDIQRLKEIKEEIKQIS